MILIYTFKNIRDYLGFHGWDDIKIGNLEMWELSGEQIIFSSEERRPREVTIKFILDQMGKEKRDFEAFCDGGKR